VRLRDSVVQARGIIVDDTAHPQMASPIYTVTVQTDDSSVSVCVAFARGTEQADIDLVLNRLTGPFARVEGLDYRMMSKLLFESREVMEERGILGCIVSREYADPNYPDKLRQAMIDRGSQLRDLFRSTLGLDADGSLNHEPAAEIPGGSAACGGSLRRLLYD
jgi:hypothetical protein